MEQLEGRRLQQWLECHVCAKYEVEQQRRVLWCVTELVRLRRKHFDVSKPFKGNYFALGICDRLEGGPQLLCNAEWCIRELS